jgi:hypothetical protein
MKNNFHINRNFNRNSGFHMTFQNEWTVSVQWGEFNYSDAGKTTAEIAAWDKDENWHYFGMDTVNGYVSANEVADFISMIAAK